MQELLGHSDIKHHPDLHPPGLPAPGHGLRQRPPTGQTHQRRRLMSIQLITFDLDDTLWDTAPVIVSAEAVLREWLDANAPNLGAVPVEHLWAIRERLLQQRTGPQAPYQRLASAGAVPCPGRGRLRRMHGPDLADKSFEVFLHARHQMEIFPEVRADAGDPGQSLHPGRGHQRQCRRAPPGPGGLLHASRCAPKTSASPSRTRACSSRRCSVARSTAEPGGACR